MGLENQEGGHTVLKTKWKPKHEIEYYLKNANRISILACDSCAKGSGTGGSAGIEVLKDFMNEWGKEVVYTDVVLACCVEPLIRKSLMKDSGAISRSDALVIDSCASGVKAAYLCDPQVPIIGVLDSIGCAVFTEQDNRVANSLCKGCGQCVITYTGGICPVFECPARTKYEPCQKTQANETQCAVNPHKDCVWKEIAKRGGDLKALNDLRRMHEAEGINKIS